MTNTAHLPMEPKAHRDRAVVEHKLSRLRDPHVAPLNGLVEEINADRLANHAAPWFDPDGGGTKAKVLFLLENPGRRATAGRGSGIISADNNDDTAANFFKLREAAGLARNQLVAWNVVPWYQPDETRTANATNTDVLAALPWLAKLIRLLPELRMVVPMGVPARDGWMTLLATDQSVRLLPTIAVPHCSPRNLNGRREQSGRIHGAMLRAASLA